MVVVSAEGLGTRIQKLRNLADLSARELSGLAGLQPSHARLIETGNPEQITAKTVAAIASVFGASIDWLYRGVGVAPAEEVMRAAIDRARRNLARGEKRGRRKKTGTEG